MKNTQTGFIGIIIIIIVAVSIVGGGYYITTTKKAIDMTESMLWDDNMGGSTQTSKQSAEEKKLYKEEMERRNSIITIAFNHDVPESEILSMKDFIEKQNGVVSVEYTSAAQGWEDFKERHKEEAEIISHFNELGQNPVEAMMVLKLNSSSDRDAVLNAIKTNAQFSIVKNIF